jgi:hypothetical protein
MLKENECKLREVATHKSAQEILKSNAFRGEVNDP